MIYLKGGISIIYQKNDIIELDNGNLYIVIEVIIYKGNNYYYLMNEKNNKDLAIVKEIEKDGKIYLKNTDTEDEFNNVITQIVKKNKDKIKDLIDI